MFYGDHGPCIHSSWPYLPFWGKMNVIECVCLVNANVASTVCIVAASVVCNLFLIICANVFNHFIWEINYFYNKTTNSDHLYHDEGVDSWRRVDLKLFFYKVRISYFCTFSFSYVVSHLMDKLHDLCSKSKAHGNPFHEEDIVQIRGKTILLYPR